MILTLDGTRDVTFIPFYFNLNSSLQYHSLEYLAKYALENMKNVYCCVTGICMQTSVRFTHVNST